MTEKDEFEKNNDLPPKTTRGSKIKFHDQLHEYWRREARKRYWRRKRQEQERL